MGATQAKLISLRPIPEGTREQLEHLLGMVYTPEEAAAKMRTIIEHVLFTTTEPLDVETLEALRVPWDIMCALERTK